MNNGITLGPYWVAADNNPADGTDRLVYDVGVGDECLATFDRREDALLYRAAPDMFSALQDIISSSEANDHASLMNAIEFAKEVVAKAEGKS